ncbi:hypothetical protein GCM10020367_18230 [Streptomyces sannanensis]|uniref:WXG100 family type VII secretion target n=1 Tax=Streptomyces sannanensis TaxID=285536 RepID=A0ABP6S8M7_9ACTN
MLTYQEIMTTDFGRLTTAADKWDSMAGEIKKVEDRYKDSVQKITMGPWTGLSAGTAHISFAGTRHEYGAAQTQAKAIASLLRDAHTQFADLKKKVESARAEAIEAGMKVSDQGIASFDFSGIDAREANTIRHDPELPGIEQSWTSRIQQTVRAFDDADQGVKIALEAVVVDGPLQCVPGKSNDDREVNGFNADAQGDIEVYEALNAEDIATRINSGDKVSANDYAELNRSFRDNADNKAFSQTFLHGLGTDGTIKLSNKLNDKEHRDLERGLANTVAGATQVPGKTSEMPPGSKKFNEWLNSPDGKFYKEWTESLDKSGTKNFGKNTDPLYGYQSFVSMMQHADARYDDQFLYQLGDDLIAAEKKQETIFTKWGGGHEGIQSDALDGLLSVMSRNPEAATSFFDPKGNGAGEDHVGNDHLKYLLGSGDDSRDWPKNVFTGYGVTTIEDPTSRMGLGAALEAATTGREPNSDGAAFDHHSEAQARVMQETITILDKDGKGDTIPEILKAPLGRALADYTVDTHAILSGTEPSSPGGGSDIKANGEDSSITSSKHSLIRVMRGVSDGVYGTTPEGESVLVYDLLYENEKRYSAEYLATTRDATDEQKNNVVGDWDNKARHVGKVYGTMTAIGSDMILDDRDTKIGNLNDDMRYTYHGVGALFTQIPVVGDPIQRMIDAATYEYSKDVTAAAEDLARTKDSTVTSTGIGGTNSLLDAWGTEHRISNTEAHAHAKGEAEQSFITGREDAYSALRTRK